MIRLFGVLLIFGGSGGAAALMLRKKQHELITVGELLFALHRIEREIRTEGRVLRDVFTALAEEENDDVSLFFGRLLQLWQTEPEHSLSRNWEAACKGLVLPGEGERVWRGLGRRLTGDGEGIQKGIALTAEELAALQLQMKRTLPEQRRVVFALSCSGAAILSILLL